MSEIPQWVWERVRVMCGVHPEFRTEDMQTFVWLTNLARYIAEHEEPPVDPLLIEARKVAAEIYADHNGGICDAILAGARDQGADVTVALAALRRGMELAREQSK